jgi:putative oxidoreductase
MKKVLALSFVPTSLDLGLLLLRLWFGLSLLILHGWPKLMGFSQMAGSFPDPLGVGSRVSLILALIGEVLCSVLLVLGLFTRAAALGGAITMGVAFAMVHQLTLRGENSGELAYAYLGVFLALFLAGAGRFSMDGSNSVKAVKA